MSADPGIFISIEGVDGAGKTTQAERLAQRFRERGWEVCSTFEPGGTPLGRALRVHLLNPGASAEEDAKASSQGEWVGSEESLAEQALPPDAELLLFLADRAVHLAQVIRPALRAGRVVICDRFHDATVAYQQYGRGAPLPLLGEFIERHLLDVRPRLTFWLDLPLAEAQRRVKERQRRTNQALHAFEDAAFQRAVRRGYRACYEGDPERVVRIAADAEPDLVAEAIWQAARRRLALDTAGGGRR